MVSESNVRRVYVHGSGRRGAEAWPHVNDPDAVFVSFPAPMSVEEQSDDLASAHRGSRVLLFAHSIGAVPAVLAAHRLDVAGLVLVEPALYDIARGDAAIERHIGIVTEARARASQGDLRGFWAILRPLMFSGPLEEAQWPQERAAAERWATTNLPWGHGVRDKALEHVRTLVVTGGWNDEYETIARVLVEHGARHEVLDGAGHRPQDLPGFAAVVDAFSSTPTI